jgi:hypothetical protein
MRDCSRGQPSSPLFELKSDIFSNSYLILQRGHPASTGKREGEILSPREIEGAHGYHSSFDKERAEDQIERDGRSLNRKSF